MALTKDHGLTRTSRRTRGFLCRRPRLSCPLHPPPTVTMTTNYLWHSASRHWARQGHSWLLPSCLNRSVRSVPRSSHIHTHRLITKSVPRSELAPFYVFALIVLCPGAPFPSPFARQSLPSRLYLENTFPKARANALGIFIFLCSERSLTWR